MGIIHSKLIIDALLVTKFVISIYYVFITEGAKLFSGKMKTKLNQSCCFHVQCKNFCCKPNFQKVEGKQSSTVVSLFLQDNHIRMVYEYFFILILIV